MSLIAWNMLAVQDILRSTPGHLVLSSLPSSRLSPVVSLLRVKIGAGHMQLDVFILPSSLFS